MKTVSMTIQVTFDENKADAESVASALDVLMNTASSTPGVLDEYGEVIIGWFYPPPEHVWDNNEIQFARLLAEISANVNIQREDWVQLCSSMDLTPAQVNSLFDRACAAWERSKEVVCHKS